MSMENINFEVPLDCDELEKSFSESLSLLKFFIYKKNI